MRISDWSSDVCSSDLVNATPRYGVVDQLFLTIRGSGRQRRPSARGLSILIDDVPINRGDNSFILGLVNPNSFARIELFPGPRANELAPFALGRSEEHTSELQSLMRISYAVFCLKKKTTIYSTHHNLHYTVLTLDYINTS